MLEYPGRGEDCRLRFAWWKWDVAMSRVVASRGERKSPGCLRSFHDRAARGDSTEQERITISDKECI
jgi:hypothetical protein